MVVLIFGVSSDMTRIEFKRECNGVGLYCLATGKSRIGGRTLWIHAKSESEHGVAEDRDRIGMG